MLLISLTEIGELLFHRVAIRPGKPLAVGIVKDTPVFSLPGKPTGALTALEIVVRSYFTDIPRATHELMINEDVMLPEKDFEYILFVKIVNNTANPWADNCLIGNIIRRSSRHLPVLPLLKGML